jgi:hypothetical protein
LKQASLQRLALRDVDIGTDKARLPLVLDGEERREDNAVFTSGGGDFPLVQIGAGCPVARTSLEQPA